MTGSIGGRWTAGNRLEPSRPNGRGRTPLKNASHHVHRPSRGRRGGAGAARARGRRPPSWRPSEGVSQTTASAWRQCVCGERAGRVGDQAGAWSPAVRRSKEPPAPGIGRGVGGARGRERAGPTRSHPEPGRDPAQRRRVLGGRPPGRRGRRGHPPPSVSRKQYARRGVEQRQLVGLITQRSGVRTPPPLPA